ncbi:hypothetical protein M422DRAFT_261701 [Sphaerobolus stellatus SS14]|uniref:F-box domain-containing protein n=1 Tax=Sphaerobolus stellatus (strain SS14) TaxID=990650 RepID=A0A0C9UM99_SPHS4|nr:hypothetical protein M422DRAFT_261701 [Sphaerobolus stellatus SS14]
MHDARSSTVIMATTIQSLPVELLLTIFHYALDVNQWSNAITYPYDLTQLRSKRVIDFPSPEISPMVLAAVDSEWRKILLDDPLVWSMIFIRLDENVPPSALRMRISRAKGLPLDVYINSSRCMVMGDTYGQLIECLFTEYYSRVRTLRVVATEHSRRIRSLIFPDENELSTLASLEKVHMFLEPKTSLNVDAFSIDAPRLREFQCIGGQGYNYLYNFSEDTRSSLRILNVLDDINAEIPLERLLDCRNLSYLSYPHPTFRSGEASIPLTAEGAERLHSVAVLEYYFHGDSIRLGFRPTGISLSGIRILIFRSKYPKGWSFSLDLFDGLDNLEVLRIRWSRDMSYIRTNNDGGGPPRRDSLCAPKQSFVLPSLRTLELKDVIIDKAFVTFALAPPEGIQLALPVLREFIFHESAITHPPLDHYNGNGDWDLPAPESATIYVVTDSGGELERYSAMVKYLVKTCRAQFISEDRNRKNWEELLQRYLA